jgi:hypothetical protein
LAPLSSEWRGGAGDSEAGDGEQAISMNQTAGAIEALADARRELAFPKLSPAETERLRRFGGPRHYAGLLSLIDRGADRTVEAAS